jgi:ComF family protein
LADPLLDLFFPPHCPSCLRRCDVHGFFCPECARQIALLTPPLCLHCGAPFGSVPDHLCQACLRRPPHFTRARAAAHYRSDSGDPLAIVIARFKYGPDPTLASVLTEVLNRNLPFAIDHDVLAPVPLHIDRLRWRGFNQAALLARGLARRRGIRCDAKLLQRLRPTPPQVGLGEAERRRNIRGAFAVRSPDAVADRSVLLIDDVYTTGATANECARTLRRRGARRVDVLVVARAI